MNFHNDSEVSWSNLHAPIGDSLICESCGAGVLDDRVHLLLSVAAAFDKDDHLARQLEIALHLKRRELADKIGASMSELIRFATEGK